MDSCAWGPEEVRLAKVSQSQTDFIREIAKAVGFDWASANVWTRHDDLLRRVMELCHE